MIISTAPDNRDFIVTKDEKTFSGNNSSGLAYEGENPIQFILNDNFVYANCINYGKDSVIIAFCNQILSTFKFIGTDPTAGWETYKNREYGFEFKYPENFETSFGSTGDFGFNLNNDQLGNFSVYVNPNFGLEGTKQTSTRTYNFDKGNVTAIVLVDDPQFFVGANPSEYITVSVEENNNSYVILASYPQDSTQSEGIFDQILSSFKFTELNPTPSPTPNQNLTPTGTGSAVTDEEYEKLSHIQKVVKQALATSARARVRTAAEIYYSEKRYFPSSLDELFVYPDSVDPIVSNDMPGIDLIEYVYTNSAAEVCIIEKYLIPGSGNSLCEPLNIIY